MTKILFVHNALQRFVVIDLALLQEQFDVEERYEVSPSRLNPIAIWQAVRRNNLVFGWFASWHTLLPIIFAKLLNKPTILVVGGYDVANVPAAGYGSQRGGVRKWLVNKVISLATQLIVNSQSAHTETITYIPRAADKINIIYHGVPKFEVNLATSRQPIILTVGGVRQSNLWRKGLLPFVQTAALLPDYQFVVVGKWYDDSIGTLRQQATPNVEFTGFLEDTELYDLYRTARIYVQASLHEGFGMSVAESMLGGCIPVVTRAGSLSEVVGEAGIYTESNQPTAIATAIEQALDLDDSVRVDISQRILTEFPMEKRRATIYELIGRITAK